MNDKSLSADPFAIALYASGLMFVLRLLLSLDDVALFCTPPQTRVFVVQIIGDVLFLVIFPLYAIVKFGRRGTTGAMRTRIFWGLLPIASFVLYEIVRNTCLWPWA